MKRTVLAIALLLCLACICSIVSVQVGSRMRKTKALVEQAETHANQGNYTAAEKMCRMASEYWNQNSFFFATFLRHDEADAVEIGLKQLTAYAITRDRDEFMALSAEVKQRILHVGEMETPKLRNIF